LLYINYKIFAQGVGIRLQSSTRFQETTMKPLILLPLAFAIAMATPVQAQQQKRDQVQTRDPSTHSVPPQAEQRAYGWELMSEQERKEHQDRMRSLKTEQEREAFQAEHHKKMQERAKAQGKTLPDMPAKGAGPELGQGKGQGNVQGQGKGLGPKASTHAQERAYGWELMTEQERKEHQDRMRSLKTEQEREAFQAEHHKKMQERAKAQGKTLPDMPAKGAGPGPGPAAR
jgi:hypothetical protein